MSYDPHLTMFEPHSSAHLLLLPRELRDRIYAYLTHPLDFTWHRDNSPSATRLAAPIPVRFPAYPIPHVFLIHPQITAEYTQTSLSNLAVVLNPGGFHPLEDLVEGGRDVQVLKRVRHVTLFVQLHARSSGESLDWGDQLALLEDVVRVAPGLATLKVAVRQHFLGAWPTVGDQELDGVLKAVSTSGEGFLPKIPRQLGGLALVQRGKGLSVGFAGFAGGGGTGVRHGVRKVGVYMHACEGERWEKRAWGVEEVVKRWPLRAYEKEGIKEIMREERVEWLMGLPGRMAEWVEVRGEGVEG